MIKYNLLNTVNLNSKENFNIITEISKNEKFKIQLDKEFKTLEIKNVVKYKYPYNYGIFPQTLSEDKDPLDAIILGKKLKALEIKEVQIIGIIKTIDEKGIDPKIICTTNLKKLSESKRVKLINKVLKFLKKLTKLKKLEINKTLYSVDEAIKVINDSHIEYKKRRNNIC